MVNRMHFSRICFFMFFSLVIMQHVGAQSNTMDSATLAASFEITSITLAGEAYDNQSFDMSVISSDGTASDTLAGHCIIQGDNYRCTFDSIEQIQNNYLNLEVHTDGKIFVVSQPIAFTKQMFKGNIDEALFQQLNVNSISVSTVGANKQITFSFLPESAYNAYTITYNPTTYSVSDVYTQAKVVNADGTYSATAFVTTSVAFRNFSAISPDSVSFDTSPYLFFSNGNQIQKQAAFADYELVDLLNRNN